MAKKICNICNTRPVDKRAGIQDSCVPCYEEGAWENQHQDNSHDFLDKLAEEAKTAGAVELRRIAPKAGIKNAGQHKSAELRAMIADAIEAEQTGCWICHPELNEAQQAPKARKTAEGERPSRKGQVINVPLRAPGETKAAVVVAKLAGTPASAVITTGANGTMLEIAVPGLTIHLVWDIDGNYDYPNSSAETVGNTRKVRNVAEALRMVAGK